MVGASLIIFSLSFCAGFVVFQLQTEEEMVPGEALLPYLLMLGSFAASLVWYEGKELFVGVL